MWIEIFWVMMMCVLVGSHLQFGRVDGEEGSRVAQYSAWLRTGRPGDIGSIPGKDERIFPLASVSRPALGPTQPPVQWVPAALFPRVKRGRGVTLTTHPHLVPRSWMSRSYTSSLPSASTTCSETALFLYGEEIESIISPPWKPQIWYFLTCLRHIHIL
jgi:hypothetical protein